ncbi:hypothetical protein NKH48_20340 [Mesorhizobium sp. M1233]|uniref:hypothetical protein n=1 Tax=Mesorhizobium sp. M1233 TaxID=2957072 RepID=UPI00333CC041
MATNAARAQDSSPKSPKHGPKKGKAWAASSVCPVALVLKCQPIGTFHVQRLRTTYELAEHCPMMASLALKIGAHETELDLP